MKNKERSDEMKKKIAVIGAKGNLGKRIIKRALEAGYEVKAILRDRRGYDLDTDVLERDLFQMTAEDLADVDVVFSAFGSGFQCDPTVNQRAFEKYIELFQGSPRKLIAIAGAGCLYTDHTHQQLEYDGPHASKRLYGISSYTTRGIEELMEHKDIHWTVVCPSRKFDPEGPYTGDCMIGENREILYNEDGESYVTYEDLAGEIVKLFALEKDTYDQKIITVATRKL